jgi:hypothetical protein
MNPIDKVISDHPAVKNFCEVFRNREISAIEQSVKVTKSKVIRDRVLIGLETYNITFNDVRKIVDAFNFPKDQYEILQEYYESELVGFAIEAEGDISNYRIYFENGIRPSQVPRLAERKIRKKRTITSLKWDHHNPEKYNITDYYRIVTNVSLGDLGLAVENSGFAVIPKFAKDALRNKKRIFLYETEDTNSDRKSFYIRMEDQYLKDLRQDIVTFSSEKLYDSLKAFENCSINYFAAGISKDREKFFNVYFLIYDNDKEE